MKPIAAVGAEERPRHEPPRQTAEQRPLAMPSGPSAALRHPRSRSPARPRRRRRTDPQRGRDEGALRPPSRGGSRRSRRYDAAPARALNSTTSTSPASSVRRRRCASDPAADQHRHAGHREVGGEQQQDLARRRLQVVGERGEDRINEADAHEGHDAREGHGPRGAGSSEMVGMASLIRWRTQDLRSSTGRAARSWVSSFRRRGGHVAGRQSVRRERGSELLPAGGGEGDGHDALRRRSALHSTKPRASSRAGQRRHGRLRHGLERGEVGRALRPASLRRARRRWRTGWARSRRCGRAMRASFRSASSSASAAR